MINLLANRFLILFFLVTNAYCGTFLNEKTEELKSGDIIFRKENTFLSDRFVKLDGRGYSHVGILYKKEQNIYVVHIERSKEDRDFKITKLKKYLEFASSYVVKRLYDIDVKKFDRYVKNLQKENPKFDLEFDLDTNDKLYCTELVYKFFKDNYDIVLTDELHSFGFVKYISVGSILQSKYLQIILEKKEVK